MKYIDAEKLIAEIERRLVKYDPIYTSAGSELKELLSFITSLQQEQPEVDLEKAFAHEYAIYHLPTFILASLVNGPELIDFIYKTARHFYELGLNSKK